MISIKKYNPENKLSWNEFIKNSKNGTFLLDRNFMDYHSDRFIDFSLMFYENEELLAVLPASLHENEVRSHGGLTYGGIITNQNMKQHKMNDCFLLLRDYLKEQNVRKVVYKRVPYIYYNYPSDEDLYALFLNNAKLVRCDISTSILLDDRIPFNERRRRNVKKSLKEGIEFRQTFDFETYMQILETVLRTKYNKSSVHTSEEITLLAHKFPDNIKLYAAYKLESMIAGVIIFETSTVAHAQYIASSDEGKEFGALDLIFDKLINEVYSDKKYFDFGISTENNGMHLNEGLINQKQEFGGRGIAYEFYDLPIME